MKKYLLAIIIGWVIYSIAEAILHFTGHYDNICFFTTMISAIIVTLIDVSIFEDI